MATDASHLSSDFIHYLWFIEIAFWSSKDSLRPRFLPRLKWKHHVFINCFPPWTSSGIEPCREVWNRDCIYTLVLSYIWRGPSWLATVAKRAVMEQIFDHVILPWMATARYLKPGRLPLQSWILYKGWFIRLARQWNLCSRVALKVLFCVVGWFSTSSFSAETYLVLSPE